MHSLETLVELNRRRVIRGWATAFDQPERQARIADANPDVFSRLNDEDIRKAFEGYPQVKRGKLLQPGVLV